MTKLNLKELRRLTSQNCAWPPEDELGILDWIERMRSFLPGILCELDNGVPTDRNIALAQLLAELEES